MPKPPIEDIVPYLTEVGDPLRKGAERVKAKIAELARCKRELKESRQSLLAHVRQHYVDSEIEAAEAMYNRHNVISKP
ncbi:MAG: hypothetical protein ACOY4U_08740 [Pseudomonadota bacterium]|jgi:hypothetical protein